MHKEAQKIANWQGHETFNATIVAIKRYLHLYYIPGDKEKNLDDMYFDAVRYYDNRWLITKSHLWWALSECAGYDVQFKNGELFAKYHAFGL